jgi:hypothetical protein
VNRRALVEQRRDLETAWMKFGSWLFTHPSLAHRLAVLAPGLGEARVGRPLAVAGALAVLVLLLAVTTLAFVGLAGAFAKFGSVLQQGRQAASAGLDAEARAEAEDGLRTLWRAADDYRAVHGAAPPDAESLYAHWARLHPGESAPLDPFDGERFGYTVEEARYLLWSAGPDPDSDHDDVVWSGELDGAAAP